MTPPTATGTDERGRATAELARAGCDVAVLASLANVTYVSGIEVPVPVGAGAELTFAPWLAIIGVHDQTALLIVPDGAAATVQADVSAIDVLGFEGFDSFHPTDPRASYLARVAEALRRVGLGAGRATVGVETRALPYLVGQLLTTEFPNATVVDVEPALQQARLIKTEREIARLIHASHLADVAHRTLATLCATAGLSEFEMWSRIGREVFDAAGHDVPLTGELVTGPRTTVVNYPNGPRHRTTEAGDAVLMDLSGRVDGYWFDCTNTHIAGGGAPSANHLRYARASQDACEAAMSALRPGALAREAAAAAEAAFAHHGLPMAHYAGHQIGVTVNELPRLVPYDETPIQAGMVFSVEPGAYEGPGGSFGARSEKMVLVTDSGPTILSTFDWGI